MNQQIETITNRIPKDDTYPGEQNRHIARRDDALRNLSCAGFTITHTATINNTESVLFIDTLTRET